VESSSSRTLQHTRATRAHVGLLDGRAPSALAWRHHSGTDTGVADVRDPRQFTSSTTASQSPVDVLFSCTTSIYAGSYKRGSAHPVSKASGHILRSRSYMRLLAVSFGLRVTRANQKRKLRPRSVIILTASREKAEPNRTQKPLPAVPRSRRKGRVELRHGGSARTPV